MSGIITGSTRAITQTVALAAAAILLSGCAATAVSEETKDPSTASAVSSKGLQEAVSDCNLEGADGVQLDSAGTALELDTKSSREESGIANSDLVCVLDSLGIPKTTQSKIKASTLSTEATEAEWEGKSLSWEWSPEAGFHLTVKTA